MPINDSVMFNVRERPLSTDLNDAESLMLRTLQDELQYAGMSEYPPTAAGQPATQATHPICYGMQVKLGGANTQVKVTPGALLQYSATLSPTPGTYDSSYRVGFNRADLTVNLPAPGSTTYYLLEAQVAENLTTQSRDILDPVSGNFAATSVTKYKQYTVTTQWTAGTTTDFPTPTGGNWVVLAGVRVTAGGTIVSEEEISDMRQTPGSRVPQYDTRFKRNARPRLGRFATTRQRNNIVNSLFFDFAVDEAVSQASSSSDTSGGLRMHSRPASSTGVTISLIKDTGTTYTNGTWYYLYLCPWNGLAPGDVYIGAIGRGVLLASATNPDNTGYNSATLGLYAPYTSTVAIGTAPCVGAFYYSTSGAAHVASQVGSGGVFTVPSIESVGSTVSTTVVANAIEIALSGSKIPKCAKLIKLQVDSSITAAASATMYYTVAVRETGTSDPTGTINAFTTTQYCNNLDSIGNTQTIEVPYNGTDLTVRLSTSSANLNPASLTVRVVGFSM